MAQRARAPSSCTWSTEGARRPATDLIAGRVDFGSFAAGSVIQFVKEGQLKPLGVIQEARSDLVPAVATTPSRGCPASMPGFISCCMRRQQRPGRSFSLLNGELNKVVGDPALKQRFANIGYDPTALTPEAAATIMRRTGEAWAPLIKRLNIKLD